MKFISNFICYLIAKILSTKKIKQEVLSVALNKIDKDFAFKLYKNSNIITSKTQIYSF